MNDFQYIRNYYKVPADYGRKVTIDGRPGIIVRDRGAYIGVNFDDAKAGHDVPCHPTWMVVYGEMGTPRKASRSRLRYLRYLDLADCFDSFRDFLLYEAKR